MKSILSASVVLFFFSAVHAQQEHKLPENEVPKAQMLFAKQQAQDVVDWSLKNVRVPEVWAKGITGKGGVVDVLDTAGDSNHPDLAGQLLPGQSYTGEALSDRQGHGTWCLGHIVAGKDGKGMVGAAYGAKARPRKVLSNQGSGLSTWIAKGIEDAVGAGTDVISLSIGSSAPDQWTQPAIQKAIAAGVLVVAAAGNDGPRENTVDWPGAYADGLVMVCVAAHDQSGATANFSSRGRSVTVSLGGVDTQGLWINGEYVVIDGTSMATPLCAGLYLLWLESEGQKLLKKERPAAFLKKLAESCDGYPNRNTVSGYGKPDAVKLISNTLPPPEKERLKISWSDLPESKRAEMARQGISYFELELGGSSPWKPTVISQGSHATFTTPSPSYEWRTLPGIGPGWVHSSVR
jgi:subtilisin